MYVRLQAALQSLYVVMGIQAQRAVCVSVMQGGSLSYQHQQGPHVPEGGKGGDRLPLILLGPSWDASPSWAPSHSNGPSCPRKGEVAPPRPAPPLVSLGGGCPSPALQLNRTHQCHHVPDALQRFHTSHSPTLPPEAPPPPPLTRAIMSQMRSNRPSRFSLRDSGGEKGAGGHEGSGEINLRSTPRGPGGVLLSRPHCTETRVPANYLTEALTSCGMRWGCGWACARSRPPPPWRPCPPCCTRTGT